jgi:hypothetical protein
MIGKMFKYIEAASSVLGLASGAVWVWALVYPGQAVDALESYAQRFNSVEDTVTRTEGKVDDFAAVYLSGLNIAELSVQEACPETDAISEIWLNIQNQSPEFQNLDFSLIGADRSVLYQKKPIFVNANAWNFSQEPFAGGMPAYVCIRNVETGAALSYEVVGSSNPFGTTCETGDSTSLSLAFRESESATEACR